MAPPISLVMDRTLPISIAQNDNSHSHGSHTGPEVDIAPVAGLIPAHVLWLD